MYISEYESGEPKLPTTTFDILLMLYRLLTELKTITAAFASLNNQLFIPIGKKTQGVGNIP